VIVIKIEYKMCGSTIITRQSIDKKQKGTRTVVNHRVSPSTPNLNKAAFHIVAASEIESRLKRA